VVMDNQKERVLLEKYKLGQATELERAMVEDWIAHGVFPEYEISDFDLEAQLSKLDKQLPLFEKQTKLWPRLAGAAAIFLMLGAGILYYIGKADNKLPKNEAYANDVTPGSVGATLTLANGQKIKLTDALNGELAKEEGVVITKSANGKLVYSAKDIVTEANRMNTLSTARGETYQLQLPDGSKVWLNAASSLTYSASLNKEGIRQVVLQGEAYFEIARDKKRPFIVKTAKQKVEVLGTHFNVNSYSDEAFTATTLLEGSVRINTIADAVANKVIRPGEQAVLAANGLRISEVDIEEAVAWKNGKFIFQQETIGTVMRKIARWYDVEVVYEADLKDKTFSGSMSRFENVSQVLRKIEMTDLVHFKVEGRRIVVMK
jgi:transmembrane sensor